MPLTQPYPAEDAVKDAAEVCPAGRLRRLAPAFALLLLPVLWAAVAWSIQYRSGMVVTGLNRPAFWGNYIVTFLFLVGVSHGALLVSAIARVRRDARLVPAARAAEATAFFALAVGALNPLLHLGRPHLFWSILAHPQPASPIFWDLVLINACLACLGGWLALQRRREMASLLERGPAPLRRLTGHPLAAKALAIARGPLPGPVLWAAAAGTVTISSAALVSAYEVVTWTSPAAGSPARHLLGLGAFWTGALLSGLAGVALLLALASLSGAGDRSSSTNDRLNRWLPPAALLWALSGAAALLAGRAGGEAERAVLAARTAGVGMWISLALALVLPACILLLPGGRGVGGAATASLLVLAGVWTDRFLLVTSAMTRPRMEAAWGAYSPSWVEISVMAGEFALIGLLFLSFTAVLSSARATTQESAT